MNLISIAEAAVALHIPANMLHEMCEQGLIEGAVRFGRVWAVPESICSEVPPRIRDSMVSPQIRKKTYEAI